MPDLWVILPSLRSIAGSGRIRPHRTTKEGKCANSDFALLAVPAIAAASLLPAAAAHATTTQTIHMNGVPIDVGPRSPGQDDQQRLPHTVTIANVAFEPATRCLDLHRPDGLPAVDETGWVRCPQ
jgi:hypothetical protein